MQKPAQSKGEIDGLLMEIVNSQLLNDAFGTTPNFHDAEVIEINLKREFNGELCPTLSATLSTENHKTGEKFLVKLLFKHIFGLKLENFNHQNVINSLYIAEFSEEYFDKIKHDKRLLGVVSEAEVKRLDHYVKFEYCFGIEAEFLCGEIILESVNPIYPQARTKQGR